MPNTTNQTHRDTPSRRVVGAAKAALQKCGCFPDWEEYDRLSRECRMSELTVLRLGDCISEHIWSHSDVDDVTLTDSDKNMPYPDIVHIHLLNKRKNARALKKENLEKVKETRELLKVKHSTCRCIGRHLRVLFDYTNSAIDMLASTRKREIDDEIKGLISESRWKQVVNPEKVLNLTDNEVSNEELEVLSLGTDFKLQSGNEILLEIAVGFEKFDFKHSQERNKPNIQCDKVKLISDIHKDSKLTLPQRYIKALNSLKSKGNLKVFQSEKGQQVVICYMNAY